jgi:diguanylate cyclase (GGDEF)-like protein
MNTEQELLSEILGRCLRIEIAAEEIYRRLQERCEEKGLRRFWATMGDQEAVHVEFWKSLLQTVQSDGLPLVFDAPEEILRELDDVVGRLASLDRASRRARTAKDALLLSYRLEFYLLNPGLTALLSYVRTASGRTTAMALYEDHLNGFIGALRKYGRGSPEMNILGETMHRLWRDNRRLQHQSHVDPLTGLLNRRGLQHAMMPLAYLARRNRYPVGVFMADIDNFKAINDRLGHLRGDSALAEVSATLKGQFRNSDVVGRYGGEEFLVFLSPVEADSVADVADTMRRRVEERSSPDTPVTISVGVAAGLITGEVESSVREMIDLADHRLLVAKQAGKNTVVAA